MRATAVHVTAGGSRACVPVRGWCVTAATRAASGGGGGLPKRAVASRFGVTNAGLSAAYRHGAFGTSFVVDCSQGLLHGMSLYVEV